LTRSILALAVAAALAQPAGAPADDGPAPVSAPAQPNAVIQWNRTLLSILRTPGNQPATVHSTRSMALVHLAVFDAVDQVGRGHRPWWRRPSHSAAADAAAHRVLVTLFPGRQQALDDQYAAMLAQVHGFERRREGMRAGERAAARMLVARADDGSGVTPPPYVPGTDPGDYQLTPPNFAPAVFTHWAHVTPFVLRRADQFRPGPPPPLRSGRYATALNEVKALGDVNSTTRTADQTLVARFWAPPIQNFWNDIAQTVALQHRDDVVQDARLFALLDVTLADSAIALYDAKYAYHLWRPISAIRGADTDGNPATVADPAWAPLAGNTAPDPSYPGAHSTISAAAGLVLARFFGSDARRFDVTSEALPGVTRSFASLSAAVDEAGLSRMYAGQHTRLDDVAGRALGRSVAEFVLRRGPAPGGPGRGW
jgi:membrane-associated phospholipid phosphatase